MNEHLIEIYKELKKLMKKYEDPLKPKFDLDSKYELWSFKEVEIAGRKRKEVSFATLIIQSSYVGFYYMPIYTDTDLKEVIDPELLSIQKGKSCFHIKKWDKTIEKQVKKALRIGYKKYKDRGWI